MYSGHTVVLATMYFTQLHYTPRGLTILRYVSTPVTFLGIIALVVSGGHYSMDVSADSFRGLLVSSGSDRVLADESRILGIPSNV